LVLFPGFINYFTTRISYDNLLEKTTQHLPATIHRFGIVELSVALKLRKQVRRSFDRACHQLREEADVGEEFHNIMRGWQFLLIDINGITERLKSIERDANRQYDVHRHPVEVEAHHPEERIQILDKEVIIFEDAENCQIEHNICCTNCFLEFPLPFISFQQQSADETEKRCQGNQNQESPIPPAIKDVTRNYNKQVPPPSTTKHKPIG
jgi:hypothetical protein